MQSFTLAATTAAESLSADPSLKLLSLIPFRYPSPNVVFIVFQRGITPKLEITQTRIRVNMCQLFSHTNSYIISKF